MNASPPAPQISLQAAKLLIAIEKYGFSLAFLFFAGTAVQAVHTEYVMRAHFDPSVTTLWDLGAVFLVQQALMTVFNLFIGIGLLSNSTPVHYPERYSEVLYPMLGTFLAMAINFKDALPPFLTINLLPADLRTFFSAMAVAVSILGYSVSIWGIATLGRSFAALVAVRKVKMGGPYRFVRHPIYCGYLFETTGLILATFSAFSIAWVILAVGVQVRRAILEERRLAAASEDYREYQKHVGFLLPGLGRKT